MRPLATALLAAVLIAATGCSDDGGDPGPLEIRVQDSNYSPAAKTITAGQTLTWNWKGTLEHSVTFTGGPTSPTQSSGSYSRTFTEAGTYPYSCAVHGSAMTGTVTVSAPAGGITLPY